MTETPKATLTVYASKSLLRSEKWRWRLTVDRGGDIVAVSPEGYANRAECLRIADRVAHGRYDVTLAERDS